jgi:transcriptional regulator NrdR family protein
MFKVQKNDGRVENFDKNKILISVIRATGTPDQAEKVLSEVEAWLARQGKQVVKSSSIKGVVLESLRRINPDVAGGYEIYRKAQAKQGL